jgi:hypothetical protein
MEVSGQLHTPSALHQGKNRPLSTEQEDWYTPDPVRTQCRKEWKLVSSSPLPSH